MATGAAAPASLGLTSWTPRLRVTGFGVWGCWFWVEGLGFWCGSLGFTAQVLGFGVNETFTAASGVMYWLPLPYGDPLWMENPTSLLGFGCRPRRVYRRGSPGFRESRVSGI